MHRYLSNRVAAFIFIIFFAVAPVLSIFGQSSLDNYVKRNGTQLTLNNLPYKFTGLNIKHANTLSWELSCAEPIGTGEGLNKALTEIDNGSGSRAKVFRSWFFQKLSTVNGVRDWSTFDHTIAVAKLKGFKIIPVLGNQWAKCDGWESDQFGYKNEQWYTTNYKTMAGTGAGLPQSYRDYVRDVVTRYKDEPTIAMWQLINEAENHVNFGTDCSSTSATSLRNFTDDMGALVKGIDSNHLLGLGTIGSGQCGARGVDYKTLHASTYIDVCEYHDYGHTTVAMPGDQWNGLQVRINQCNELGKPIFIGETGITTTEAGGNLQIRADLLEAKLAAQFGNGVVGVLMWEWSNDPNNIFAIKDGDPILAVLGKYGMAATVKSRKRVRFF
jgi:hypothetical protein